MTLTEPLAAALPRPLMLHQGDTLDLAAATACAARATPAAPGWRLLRGALRFDRLGCGGRERVVQLALPGDLVGLEPLLGVAGRGAPRALLRCELLPLPPLGDDPTARSTLLGEALCQQWQRAADMTALRSGAVPERIKRLLLMLAQGAADLRPGADRGLPRVRDIADLVDSTPESVSRVISALRRLQLLDGRQAGRARYDAVQLAASALPLGLTRSDANGLARAGLGTPPPPAC